MKMLMIFHRIDFLVVLLLSVGQIVMEHLG